MRTPLMMTLSALFLAVIGLLLTFMPQETAAHFGSNDDSNHLVVLVVQIAGAHYMGFAIMNWMARASLIGGIYNRPIALGNFLHFTMASIVLLKELMADSIQNENKFCPHERVVGHARQGPKPSGLAGVANQSTTV